VAPNYQGKRRRSTEGAEGTNTGHENAEGMACVGVRLTAQLGAGFWVVVLHVVAERSLDFSARCVVGGGLASSQHD